jgi:hypothetical protein
MKKKARVVHHIHGRLRLKVHAAKNQPAALHRIKQSIEQIPAVKSVQVSPSTGSVLVHYTGESKQGFHDQLEQVSQAEEIFHLVPMIGEASEVIEQIEREAEFLSDHSEAAKAIINGFSKLNQEIKRSTGNFIDLNVLLPFGLAALSFGELGIDASTPLWVTLGIFSFNSFVSLHSHPPKATNDPDSLNPNQ